MKFLKPFLLIIFAVFLFKTAVFCQFRFDRWSTDTGLPQNGVRGIGQTPDGYLWVCTLDGLARFDGLQFKIFNKNNTEGIKNNRFIGLTVDKKGYIFARPEDGSLTVGKDGVFFTLSPEEVPNDSIADIVLGENGETFFQMHNKADQSIYVYQFADGKFVFQEKYPLSERKKIIKGQSGKVWTITAKKTIESFQGRETIYPLDFTKGNVKLDAFEAGDGSLWIGNDKVYRLSGGNIEKFGEAEGLSPKTSYKFFWEDFDKSVWFASGGGSNGGNGLIQYKDGKFSFLNKEQGFTADISIVFRDREGGQWFATSEGLFNRKLEVIKSFNTEKSIPKIEAYPILQDRKGKIWVGTAQGLFTIENGKYQPVKLTAKTLKSGEDFWSNPKVFIESFWEDEQGRMWIGLSGSGFIVKDGIASAIEEVWGLDVFAIQPDKKGNVWLATNKGVLQYRDDKLVNKFTTENGLANNYTSVIFEDSKGVLWFGGGGGITRYENGKFKSYTKQDGLADGMVRSIYEDADGILWFGTYESGLIRFKDGKFFNFSKENGLFSNGVFAIREDRHANFWISSNQGIYRVNRHQLNDFAEQKINFLNSVGYGKLDGMPSVECNGGRQPASMVDQDGNFWFPTQEGLVRVNPEAEKSGSYPPPVVIESATIEREPSEIGENLTIPAGKRNVEINYSAISFNHPEQMRFKYKLENYDSDWVEADKRRSAFYSYLPPGNYVFRVQAANSEGVWNEAGASLKIEAVPFFYQTKLFKFLCVAAFILAMFGLWRYWIYNFKRREKRLKLLVQERTAELDAANLELQFLANSDDLTKISNRRRFEKFLKDEWNRAVRAKTKISLILLDVDYFKLYNDTYGHPAGDACLQKIAETVSGTLKRPTDLAARYGGEEFIIALAETEEEGVIEVAKNILENIVNLQIPHETSKTEKFVTVSLGIATFCPTEGNAEADLIKQADKALYQAKENGRNQFYLLGEVTEENSILDKEIIL